MSVPVPNVSHSCFSVLGKSRKDGQCMKPIASLQSDASPSLLGSEQVRLPVENHIIVGDAAPPTGVANLDRNEAMDAGINGSVNESD